MKKIVSISLVFALIAGAAFAIDLGGTVFGHVNVIEGSSEKDSDMGASGGLDRLRFEGAGEVADGAFGAWMRLEGSDAGFSGYAWWKPIDQLKFYIGNNGDGMFGKEGVTGWGFNQMPNDSGVATNYGIWFGDGWGSSIYVGGPYMHNRYTFTEGIVENSAILEIAPMDIISIILGVPFMRGGKAEDVYKAIYAQFNLNLDFGNIAITYDGGGRSARLPYGVYTPQPTWDDPDNYGRGGTAYDAGGALFVYFGGNFGDLGLDVGFSYHLTDEDTDVAQPIALGLGLKYAADAFGIKFRVTAALGGDKDADLDSTFINASILPYYAITDNISAFLNAGLGIVTPPSNYDDADAIVGWYVNPYLRVGAEWGPTFYFGLQIWSDGVEHGADKDKYVKFAVPISLMVSF